MRRVHFRYSLLSFAVASAVGAPSAFAQQNSQPGESLEQITVTGTRIRRADYTSPTPTTTVDGEYLRDLGLVSVGDALTQNPTNVSRFQPSTTGSGSFFVGTTMANLRGLNPYFGTRTLTLVDSMRHVATNQGGGVDMNFIPSVIIDRMETVTGGASASYGSDAVAGVVNILLDKEFTGIKLETDYGASGEGDADNRGMGLAAGKDLWGGRGHVVVGYEFQDQNSIDNCYTERDWCRDGRSIFVNSTTAVSTTNTPLRVGPASPPGQPVTTWQPIIPGQPHSIIVQDLRSGTTPNGLLSDRRAGATRYQFNDAGTALVPYNAGQYAQVQAARNVIGGDGRSVFDGQTLMPDIDRNILYTHFNYDINDSLRFTSDFSWGKVNTANFQSGPSNVSLCIRPDNAYLGSLDAPSRALITGAANQGVGQTATGTGGPCTATPVGQTTATFGWGPLAQTSFITKDFSTQQEQRIETIAEVARAVFGVSGDIGESDSWTWDAYYQVGHATRDQIGQDYRTQYRFLMATDSVIDPATGQPACRVTLAANPRAVYPIAGLDTSLIAGCAPINPFGQTMSAAAHDYAFDPLEEFNTIDQQVIAGSVSGDLWKGWGAGPMLGAAGIEYRVEELDNLTSKTRPQAHRDDMSLTFGNDFAGETKVAEAFFEIELPLLAGKRGADSWNLNTAVRRTHYDNTETRYSNGAVSGQHDVSSWKVSTTYDPVDWVRIRASRSRDIRAAGFRELYYQQSIQSGAPNGRVVNPYTRVANDEAFILLTGSPDLRPEIANTNTFGVVFSPQNWAEGLQFSVDYYEIKLNEGVQRGSSQLVADNCAAATGPNSTPAARAALCPLVTFGPDFAPTQTNPGGPGSNVESVLAPYYNDLPYEAAGIDIGGNYTFDIGGSRSMSIRLLASHALNQTVVIGTNRLNRDIAGQTGNEGFLPDYTSAADWNVNLILGYHAGPLNVTTQARYTSSGKLDLVSPRRGPDDPLYDPLLQNSIIDNNVPAYLTQNVTASYDFGIRSTSAEIWMSVNNLWDKEPPFSAGTTGGVNGIFYDTVGRTYRVGVRLSF
jgi:iron complex outermembrane receptor protein